MKWEGIKIRELAKEGNLKLQVLAELIGVSRQTVNDWIKGQVPKGSHLIMLCQIFQVKPETFFFDDTGSFISVPVHRTRMAAKVSTETQEDAVSLAKQYLNIFRNHKNPEVIRSIRSIERNKDYAQVVANEFRLLSGISRDVPIDYEHTFKLAEHLGIYLIFRGFPKTIKSYAFFTKIHDLRIVFINKTTNIIDLIFPLLHEFIHATRDDIEFGNVYEREEEKFCDDVANFVQFPKEYVKRVYESIKDLRAPLQINILKGYARSNKHSLYGIVKAIQNIEPNFKLKVESADTNLRKEFPLVGEIIFNGNEPRFFVRRLFEYSKKFADMIAGQIDQISDRKLADLLDLESPLDAKEVKKEIRNCILQ